MAALTRIILASSLISSESAEWLLARIITTNSALKCPLTPNKKPCGSTYEKAGKDCYLLNMTERNDTNDSLNVSPKLSTPRVEAVSKFYSWLMTAFGLIGSLP